MTAVEYSGKIEVRFQYNPAIVNEIKSIPGARWYSSTGCWVVPAFQKRKLDVLLKKYGTEVKKDDTPMQVGEIPAMPEPTPELLELLKREMKLQPYPYQLQGIQAGVNFKKFINGDSPGLGKTLQSIATVVALDAFPCLVICPATLKENWRREWSEKFTNKRSMILNDSVKRTWKHFIDFKMTDVIITNYESLKKYFVESIDVKEGQRIRVNNIKLKESASVFKSIIIDESHKIKDGGSQQSKFCMLLAQNKDVVIELTGTPYVNNVSDLIPQLICIKQLQNFGGYSMFMRRYCAGYSGASNLKELNYRLHSTCFFRRLKSEVLEDLPDKVRQVILCDIDNRAEYDKAKNDFVSYLREMKGHSEAEIRKKLRGEFMVQLGILKGLSAKGKLANVIEWTDELIHSGRKVVLFCTLREIGDRIINHYGKKAVAIRGGSTMEERQRSVDSFQNNPDTMIALCSIKAAGVGLTLTASSDVGFIEFPWTDADCDQCESRCHRIGQKDSVRAAYFLGNKTMDQYCYNIILNKRKISDQIAGQEVVEEQVIDEMINLFTE